MPVGGCDIRLSISSVRSATEWEAESMSRGSLPSLPSWQGKQNNSLETLSKGNVQFERICDTYTMPAVPGRLAGNLSQLRCRWFNSNKIFQTFEWATPAIVFSLSPFSLSLSFLSLSLSLSLLLLLFVLFFILLHFFLKTKCNTVIHFYFGRVQFSVKRKFAVSVRRKFR